MNDAPLGVGHSSEQAYDFYDSLTATLGIDGFETEWEDQDGGKPSRIVLALNSNQVKNVDNLNPTENPDIRYSRETKSTLMLDERGDLIPTVNKTYTEEDFSNNAAAIISDIMQMLKKLDGQYATIKSTGEIVFFDETTAEKYTHSNSMKKVDNERKSLKANAAEGIIAIVENAKTNRGGKPDLKSHVKNRNNAKNGFSYYKSEFAIPNGSGKYDLVGTSIIVRNADNGKSYVYDFDDIKIKKKGLSLESVKNTESLSNLTPEKVNVSAPSITDVSTNDQTKSRLQGENDTRNSKGTDIDDDLLDDAMFESLFDNNFIDELEDELDDQKYVSKKYTGWLEELMDSLEESIKAAESGTKRERKKAQRHLLNDAPFGVGQSGPPLRLT